MVKELNKSIDLPLEDQFRENWNWENSSQRYELDIDFQEKSYFTEMDPEELCFLVRHLDNFMMERGISYTMLHNYYHAIHAFNKLDEPDNGYQEPESYVY